MLTADNYFSLESAREFMSVHQYQNWQACAKAEFERQAGRYVPETPDVFLQGHYVEVGLQGTETDVAQFQAAHPEMFTKPTKTGETHLLAKYELCTKMIARAKRDFGFMELMRGDAQVIFTGEIQGVQWKGKPDVVKPDWKIPCFVDLKTTAGFGSVWESYFDLDAGQLRNEKVPWYDRYWFQLSVYQELLRQKTGKTLLPIIAGISKEDPPGLRALTFDSTDRLQAELSIGLANLGQIMAFKRGDAEPPACGDCDWCREHLEMRIVQAENFRKRGR